MADSSSSHDQDIATADAEEARKAKRRVPLEKRKRAAHSCDRCKSKRIKCIQDNKEEEPSPSNPCVACVKAGVECMVTIERKVRLYGAALIEDKKDKYLNTSTTSNGVTSNYMTSPKAKKSQSLERAPPQRQNSGGGGTGTGSFQSPFLSFPPSLENMQTYQSAQTQVLPNYTQASLRTDSTSEAPNNVRAAVLDMIGSGRNGASFGSGLEPANSDQNSSSDDISGASACLSLAAELRALISRYDKGAPFVQETLSQTLGSNGLAEAILKDDISWLSDHVFMSEMLDIYFTNIHPLFPVFHKGAFLKHYEENRAANANPRTDCWRLSLSSMVAISASWKAGRTAKPDKLIQHSQEAARLASKLVGNVVSNLSFTCVQSLLVWSYYLHHHCHREGAWNVVGICSRMAFSLGLQDEATWRDPSSSTGETRKLTFWTLYRFERFLSASLAQFQTFSDADITLEYPLEHATDITAFSPRGALQTEAEIYKILGRAGKLYRGGMYPDYADVSRLYTDMTKLKASLPPHLVPSSRMLPYHRQTVTLIHCTYHAVVQYITRASLRALVSQYNNRSATLSTEDALFLPFVRVCMQSAIDCISLLSDLYNSDLLDMVVNMGAYWAYLSALVLAVPLACEIANGSSHADVMLLWDQTGLARDQAVSALRSLHIIFNRPNILSPTFRHFAAMALEVSKAVRTSPSMPTARLPTPDLIPSNSTTSDVSSSASLASDMFAAAQHPSFGVNNPSSYLHAQHSTRPMGIGLDFNGQQYHQSAQTQPHPQAQAQMNGHPNGGNQTNAFREGHHLNGTQSLLPNFIDSPSVLSPAATHSNTLNNGQQQHLQEGARQTNPPPVFSFDTSMPMYDFNFNSSLEMPSAAFSADIGRGNTPLQGLTAWLYGTPTEYLSLDANPMPF